MIKFGMDMCVVLWCFELEWCILVCFEYLLIVCFYEVGVIEFGRFWFVFEFVDGELIIEFVYVK